MNQQTIELINQYIADNPSATFFELLDIVTDNGYRLVPDWEVINDEAMINQIIEELVEHHDYTESEAKECAENFGYSIVNSMWDQYSHTLSELVAGY